MVSENSCLLTNVIYVNFQCPDEPPTRGDFVQRRGPRVPKRDIRVVAQAAEEGELSEEFLGKHDPGGEREERVVWGGPSETVCHSLLGFEALALLQGLRL